MSSPVLIEQLDVAIDVLLTDPDAAIPSVDPAVADLLGVAAELRTLPRPDFRAQLKSNLIEFPLAASTMRQPELQVLNVVAGRPQLAGSHKEAPEDILPTLFGHGYGTYRVQRSNFALSGMAHALALALILTSSFWMMRHQGIKAQVAEQVFPLDSDYVPFTKAAPAMHGGGGGGDHDTLQASQGRLPKPALEQITPPQVVVRNHDPKLSAEPTVVLPPEVKLPNNPLLNLGDPKSSVLGPPSNGTGSRGGIGNGFGGGIGAGSGDGGGPGVGGGLGGGVYRPGVGGVTAPRAIFKPDPEYSPEARQAKFQGTVVVSVIIGADGRAHSVHVERSLG